MIYFIRCPYFNAIKIGKALDPERRMRGFQIGCPAKLMLIGCAIGGKREEKQFHEMFRHLHIRGEWFKADPGMIQFIESMIRMRQRIS